MHDHVHERVDLGDRVPRALRLGPADVALPVDDLALQIGLVDDVELDDAEGSHPGGREVHQGGGPQATRADAQHSGVLEPLLPDHADLGDDDVAAVAPDLVDGEFGGRFDQGIEFHVGTPRGRFCLR